MTTAPALTGCTDRYQGQDCGNCVACQAEQAAWLAAHDRYCEYDAGDGIACDTWSTLECTVCGLLSCAAHRADHDDCIPEYGWHHRWAPQTSPPADAVR